jgi:phage host-nuclease inhibitor protein Gam
MNMTKLTNSQADALTSLIKKTSKLREYEKKARALKVECTELLETIEDVAKANKGSLNNGEHLMTFKLRKGGGYEVKPWKKYGIDKIVTL